MERSKKLEQVAEDNLQRVVRECKKADDEARDKFNETELELEARRHQQQRDWMQARTERKANHDNRLARFLESLAAQRGIALSPEDVRGIVAAASGNE